MATEQEFHDLDFQIMRFAFDVHNQMGRFYNEKIYQNELLNVCLDNGLNAQTEVKIELTHKSFTKDLFIDLLLENSSIYELKATAAIIPDHRRQTLDYLFLSNTQHGKIINFRTPSITHEFVSTRLDDEKRHKFSIHHKNWLNESETAHHLKSLLLDLFNDWGLFLNTTYYKEAVCHLLGGEEKIIRAVPIKRGGIILEHQNIPLLSPTDSFCISSVTENPSAYQMHLQRFLNRTELQKLHWINLCRSEVHFTSLQNTDFL
jgi:GxxExxY protein